MDRTVYAIVRTAVDDRIGVTIGVLVLLMYLPIFGLASSIE